MYQNRSTLNCCQGKMKIHMYSMLDFTISLGIFPKHQENLLKLATGHLHIPVDCIQITLVIICCNITM